MTFTERVASFLKKSLDGEEEEKDKKEKGDEEGSEEDLNLDGGGEGEEGNEMEKSHLEDATEIMSALVDEIKSVNKSLTALAGRQDGIEKSQNDLGEAVVGVAELLSKVAGSPNPVKSVMGKGGLGNGGAGDGGGIAGQLSHAEFEQAQAALAKSCRDKRLSIQQCTRLESEMQKAMVIPGYQMT